MCTKWQFQNAKLEFESELIKASEGGDIKYSIVRPTAFFKSVSGTYLTHRRYVHFHCFQLHFRALRITLSDRIGELAAKINSNFIMLIYHEYFS